MIKDIFKGIARVTRGFSIETPVLKAQGAPAVLIAVGGILVGAGIARALVKGADRLPETLKEARQLADTLKRNDVPRLHA